jgi:hypothetical protein
LERADGFEVLVELLFCRTFTETVSIGDAVTIGILWRRVVAVGLVVSRLVADC